MRLITASEVEEHAFCSTKWWLLHGRKPTAPQKAIDAGIVHDARLHRELRQAMSHEDAFGRYASVGTAATLLAVALFILATTPRLDLGHARGAFLLAFYAAATAGFFLFWKALVEWRAAREWRRVRKLDPQLATYVESTMVAPEIGLKGRPDRWTWDGGVKIPIEVKHRERSPLGAFESHKLQVAAYCAILHEETGRRPPYGVLQFVDGEERVDYTPELESKLRAALNSMRTVHQLGSIRRNHDQPNKCVSCALVERCPNPVVG